MAGDGAIDLLNVEEAIAEGVRAPDLYLSPEYARAVEVSDGAEWEVARCRFSASGCSCYYVYLKRPVPGGEGTRRDLISPYGYCGPWGDGDPTAEHWLRFRELFVEMCVGRGYVAEFIRFSPFLLEQQRLFREQSPDVTAWKHQTTVAVDLTGGVDAYLKKARRSYRKTFQKALKLGYTSSVVPCAEADLSDFKRLYNTTMTRNCARDYYFFSDGYYEQLVAGLPRDGCLLVQVAKEGAAPAASGIYFVWDDKIHYHLGASETEFLGDGVNSLMHHSAAVYGVEHGLKLFHLGGGLKDNDALHQFKSGIGDMQMEWWLGKSVLNPTLYEQLVRERAEELGCAPEELTASGFFPAYRASPPSPAPAPAPTPESTAEDAKT
mmetsp:Transcript_27158/g.89052  ORF Transcript_27158/g.89052 Transcript_27158/m.89052 type:complete len:379 (+) Transcript_27158:87-1223(+)|eukprot:CAMPEP_0170135242 /NCGR_PEP_ID=MMETSP0033_2-20121228/2379_1 /TAXON_ID=195969 /ORGANISM="Dolichomastix tenuilepis, Strain CCMP3274" /LENGTH=378 /DNA_ID=CAMNT_0010370841 /DNA_START=64 /DNA_END=1200 /DNA_ORIENTATION=-